MTEVEPEWDDDARDDVLALLDDEADRCPYCGRPEVECAGPLVDEEWVPASRHLCEPTWRMQQLAAQWRKGEGGALAEAPMSWRMKRRPRLTPSALQGQQHHDQDDSPDHEQGLPGEHSELP